MDRPAHDGAAAAAPPAASAARSAEDAEGDAARALERAAGLGEGGAHAQALALLDRALEGCRGPDAAALHAARGWALENLGPGCRAEARAAYERAVALDRGQLWARLGLATLLGQDGREDEAAAICRDLEQEAAARLAREPEYHELIGWCRYRLGRLADAAAAFERALAVDADWVSARFDLALVRLLLGDGAAAQRHCEEGLRSLRRRDAALRAGPLRVAIDDLDEALQRQPRAVAPGQAASLRRRLAEAHAAAGGGRG